MNAGEVSYVYDCDGARVAKTAGGSPTHYLIDDLNPTGYSQVLEEVVDGTVRRVYTYGQMLISQSQLAGATWTPSYYGYDGHASVTFLTDDTGAVTDTYDYDAYGNVVASTGTTANEYRYDGQRFDADLGMYHLRARYYDAGRGRFATVDPFGGDLGQPLSLHRYIYAAADPVNLADRTGLFFAEYGVKTSAIAAPLSAQATIVSTPMGVAGIGAGALAILGHKVACEFWRAWSGFAAGEEAAASGDGGAITVHPPGVFLNCAPTLQRERTETPVIPERPPENDNCGGVGGGGSGPEGGSSGGGGGGNLHDCLNMCAAGNSGDWSVLRQFIEKLKKQCMTDLARRFRSAEFMSLQECRNLCSNYFGRH
jgi:RHS repeat-associated protein